MVDPRFGAFVTQDLANYHVPVHADIPARSTRSCWTSSTHANVLGSKGVGELGICGAGAAVANAVYNACGARVRDYGLQSPSTGGPGSCRSCHLCAPALPRRALGGRRAIDA